MLKRIRSGLVFAIMICLLLPTNVRAAGDLTDITNHWSQSAILQLQAGGYVKGYPDNTFRPDMPMTRAGFVTVLVSCIGGIQAEGNASAAFKDAQGHWAQASINQAVKMGIIVVAEYPNGFAPDNAIKRSEAAAMLVRAQGQKPDTGSITFKDAAEINKSLYKGYIKKAVDTGIMSGYSDGSFRPFTSLTRAQTCALMVRLLDKLGKKLPAADSHISNLPSPVENSLTRGYRFFEGNNLIHQGTQGIAMFDGENTVIIDEITIIDPSRFMWNGSKYDFIGERIRINDTDYNIIDTIWRGSNLQFDIYLSRS